MDTIWVAIETFGSDEIFIGAWTSKEAALRDIGEPGNNSNILELRLNEVTGKFEDLSH